MKCPYVTNLICDYPDKTGDIICTTCPHYNKGIRETGATPILAWLIDKIKSNNVVQRIILVALFAVFALASLYMAATSENLATGFVYVLFTFLSVFLCAYFVFCKSE